MSPEEFEKAVGRPLAAFAQDCHAASLALVRSGVLGPKARVARGWCPGVRGQHSWVAVDGDCYDPEGRIVDPTLWSYREDVSGVWEGDMFDLGHRPHGTGNIATYGCPTGRGGEVIALDGLSAEAENFLQMVTEIGGPMDVHSWMSLASAPVGGWPAAEIIGAMLKHERLAGFVPIDIVGMLTDSNPGGLYLATEEGEDRG